MSTRRSSRVKKLPVRYTPTQENQSNTNYDEDINNDTQMGKMDDKENRTNVSAQTTSSRRSRRSQLQIELEKLEEAARLEKEMDLRKIERQRKIDDMEHEMERQRKEHEMERQRKEHEIERQRKEMERQRKEMERQTELEHRELQRQKRLLEKRAELKSASVSSRNDSVSEVGSSLGLNDNFEEPVNKVENWLCDKQQLSNVVQLSPSAIVSSAVEKLADSFRQAIHLDKSNSTSLRQHLPPFSGKPEEWPIFYSAYEKTKNSFSEDDNLIRLRNCLEGEAFKTVKPLFISGKNLNAVLKTLQLRFGRPELILESMQKKTKMLPPVKEEDINSLIEFSTNVLNFTTTAESLEMTNYMTNPQLLTELLDKLPYSLKYSWAQHVSTLSLTKPDLKDLSDWLENQCSIMSIYFRPQSETSARKKNDPKLVLTSSTNESKWCCMFCDEKHESAQCKIFRKAGVSERWKMVAEKKLCFFCLRKHAIKFCKVKKVCGINDCKLFHSRFLHSDKSEKPSNSGTGVEPSTEKSKEVNNKHTEQTVTKSVLLRVCPVTLYGPKCQIDTFALLDDGSTVSLLDSTTADKLGVEGKTTPLTTCWSNSTCHYDSSSRKVSLQIKGLYEDEVYDLENVRTQSSLDLPLQHIDTVKLREKWSHLNSITQPLPVVHSKPTILIGQDNINLILTRKVIEGPANSPVLSWSYLGWTMHGKCAKFDDRVDENFTLTTFEYDKLHNLVKESFQTDDYGTIPFNEIETNSNEVKRAVNILEQTTKKVGDHYETGLLWKSDNVKYPSSYENAVKRLKTIENKMEKDRNFHKKYTAKIEDYLEKGYVRKLTEKEAEVVTDHTYYLPHFGVTNPNKPDKLRLVFDAAAKSSGVSFNDALLSGPDYLNPLPSVLLKFRLGKYAMVGDIKEMFHQVKIRDEDVDAQRFLWRNGNVKQKPDVYLMKAMTFGATCSPSTALYVVNHNAKQFETIYPEASKSILTKEYMDDLLDSTDTEEEARRRIKEITEIHKSGGFQICNWLSNSKEVLKEVPENLKANSTKQLKSDTQLPTERVLGLWWNAESDNFDFHHSTERITFSEIIYPTKREILRAAMSIFDPLGFVCPTTIKGRLLVQDVWRIKVSWDEVLPQDLCDKWQTWLEEVKNLRDFKIPRCYFEQTNPNQNYSLHIFVDASQEAFSAVIYLVQKIHDSFRTMLVTARAKVAPLKPTTIPRLELQAAVLGSRLAQTVHNDIGIPIAQRTFWSDSVIVLHWLKSEPKVYKQFVSNRIGEIQTLSKPEEWKWVPTKQNPADAATRSNTKFNLSSYHDWIYGPSFLSSAPDYWPEQPPTLQSKEDPEMKQHFVGVHEDTQSQLIDIQKFSSWEKATRTTAWVLRYVEKLQRRYKTDVKHKLQVQTTNYKNIAELQPEELKKAENLLLIASQKETFSEERSLLSNKKTTPKSSRINLLSPFLDGNNIMRMSSRTVNSPELQGDQKNPIILDSKSHAARLIAKYHHEECFHQGLETVICKIRERFWIVNLRSLVKKIKRECMRCKIENAKPIPPQMAPLPECRVTKVSHPFFYTGVDYFGPIEVTVGRRHEKRYGVLFTCLSTRAVHLEVAHSLDAQSCIMAIQRFISRRSCPTEMFSDNGTNFVASDKELRNSVMNLNHTQIQRATSRQGIKWNFNPPKAPHMGGCWERLIRSVKTALKFVMRSQYPKDEELRTFLTRVEYIINCRPLTHVSVDPSDPEPLTPNHFLLEGFKITLNDDKLSKKQLTKIRSLLDNFWKRWIREYLPCLTRRCKWHKSPTPPNIGDLAIIVEEDNPRNSWPLGRISAVYPGRDNQIRVVDIQTTSGTFRRPLTKVAVLPEEGKDVND